MKFYSKSGKIYNTMIGVLSENITSKVFPSKLKKDHESDVIYRRPIVSERKVTVKYGEYVPSHIILMDLVSHLSGYGKITVYDNKNNKIFEDFCSDYNDITFNKETAGYLVSDINVRVNGDVIISLE